MSFDRQTILKYNYCYYSILPNAYNFTSQVIYIKASILHEEHFFLQNKAIRSIHFDVKWFWISQFIIAASNTGPWRTTNYYHTMCDGQHWSFHSFGWYYTSTSIILLQRDCSLRQPNSITIMTTLCPITHTHRHTHAHAHAHAHAHTHTHITRKYDVIRKTGSA